MKVNDGTITFRNSLPSLTNPVAFFDGPECIPVNSAQKFRNSSKTARTYSVVYLTFGSTDSGHGEFILQSCGLSLPKIQKWLVKGGGPPIVLPCDTNTRMAWSVASSRSVE